VSAYEEIMEEVAEALSVEDYLNQADYEVDPSYVPSDFALEFVTFIKLCDGGESENKTPLTHYKMLDTYVVDNGKDIINMCHRGFAKSTVKEFLILYIGVYGEFLHLGKVPYAIYVSDSIDNGVKKMRKSLEFRWNDSKFLQEYIPTIKFTDTRWEFLNREGNSFVVSAFGAKTGVRGTRENKSRPVLALLDDLISDADARSATVIADVEDTVYKAIDYALHPTKRLIIWSGTPFNQKDPLYKAVNSGAWNVNVFPVCEAFPCTEEEFRGSWEDRFPYSYVKRQYDKALASGKISTFNQELMLRIMSEDDRLIHEGDIAWYRLDSVLKNKERFNFYITTDFATSEKQSADYSAISVWAYNYVGDWFWVDGILQRQEMDKNINDLFRLAQLYRPQAVGVEVNGQQAGFIPWIQDQMLVRNCFFPLASDGNNNKPGIRSNSQVNKLQRFNVVVPWFKQRKIFLPNERKNDPIIQEATNELSLVSFEGFKSKHDDFLDTVSMLPLMRAFKPSEIVELNKDDSGMWEIDLEDDDSNALDSYIV
jgi:predicted phage terminase large subunit-like protein